MPWLSFLAEALVFENFGQAARHWALF